MARQALAAVVLALCAGACSAERHTTYVTADAPVRHSVVVGVTDVQLTAEARAACDSYGIAHGTANYDRCVQNEFAARRPG
jgi:hypothetical protein